MQDVPVATTPPAAPPTASAPPLSATPEKILCNHCQRTATNGIKCQGICVADSNY